MSPHKLRHSFATLMAEETNGNLNLIIYAVFTVLLLIPSSLEA